jgi:nucleotide-binding universal stress UspA family protein
MPRSFKVLIAHDGSAHADAALEDLSRAGLPAAAQARVVSFADVRLPPVAFLPGEADAWYAQSIAVLESQSRDAGREADARAKKAAARLQKLFPGWKITTHAALQDPAGGILDAAARWKPSLVVLGTHGRTALKRLLLGSVSHRVLSHAPVSVRLGRKRSRARKPGPSRVLIAVDGSKQAEAALTAVARRAWKASTVFHVMVVSEYPAVGLEGAAIGLAFQDEWKDLTKRIAEKAVALLAKHGRKAGYSVREGDPRAEIVREAVRFKPDTLFIGSHANGALRRFLLGGTSLYVAEHAPCSVEVIR